MRSSIQSHAEIEGYSELHRAAAMDEAERCRSLVRSGAQLNARTRSGDTPLHIAALWGRPETIAILIGLGAPLEARNSKGETALHRAVAFSDRSSKTCDALMFAGANPNARCLTGETPLHVAVGACNLEVSSYLLRDGADYVPDARGKTPFQKLDEEARGGGAAAAAGDRPARRLGAYESLRTLLLFHETRRWNEISEEARQEAIFQARLQTELQTRLEQMVEAEVRVRVRPETASRRRGRKQEAEEEAETETEEEEEGDEPPDNLLCPITFSLMKDPVVGVGGQTAERSAMERHISQTSQDPWTRQTCGVSDLRPNLLVKKLIEEWNSKSKTRAKRARVHA